MSIGTALNTARIGQCRSVEDLSSATRIRPGVIRALERDDYDACGGVVYARGHVRSLAAALGLDPAPLLAQLTTAGAADPPRPLGYAAPLRERRPGSRWTTAAALVLGILACLAGLRLLLPDADAPTLRESTAPTAGPAPPAAGQPQVRSDPRALRANGVTAALLVTGARCWVSVHGSDGRRRMASTLTRGQTVQVSDPQRLLLVLGDAGAVELVVDGQRVKRLGSAGGVARLLLEHGQRVQRLDRGGRPRV